MVSQMVSQMVSTADSTDSTDSTGLTGLTGLTGFTGALVTIAVALQDYLLASRSLAPRTQGWYEGHLGPFGRWCASEGLTTLAELRAVHLRTYQDRLVNRIVDDPSKRHATGPLSPYTIRGAIQVIKGWSRWLVNEDYLEADPFAKVKRVRAPQQTIEAFTAAQIQALLGACPATPLGTRDRALVLLLLDTGLRVSECCGLRLAHIHVQEREPWLEVAWQTSKGQKAREVGLGLGATRALTRYLRLARPTFATSATPGEDHVWLSHWGKPMTRNGVDQALYDLRDHAGVTGVRVSAHTFRHTFAVAFLKATGDIYRLSKLLGHSSVAVTEHYLRSYVTRDARAAWVSAADRLLEASGGAHGPRRRT